MERVTISVSDEFAAELTAFMGDNHHENRSEAVRDLARLDLKQRAVERGAAGECVATLSYTYDHHMRELPKRLAEAHYAHRGLHVAAMHVHLDADRALEVAVLRGDARAVRDFSTSVIAERGVTDGQITFAWVARSPAAEAQANRPPTDI